MEFKFNFEEINPSDIFYLYGETNESSFFDYCQKESETQKILSCYIYKDKIEEILTVSNAQFKLGVLNKNIPLDIDKKLLWICPVKCIRKYLKDKHGWKTRWYHKLFWKGKYRYG